ncbi:MAG: hypothetical protein L7S42_08820, partial [Flavobacteriaceae bacterium]|nr:hypothetical protein [Flavobacteriaceae bacterium]
MKRLLFILFYFQTTVAVSQQIPGLNGKFIVFPEDKGFRFIDKDYSYFTSDAKSFTQDAHGFRIDNLRLTYLYSTDKIRLLAAGGGSVYEYNNDSLYRIDKSFEFQSRFNAFNF